MYGEKVTVAILAYYKEFLHECIESVLAQTYKNIEVIVYDDCSPSNLKEIVDAFSDSRLHYIRNDENLGGGENFNKAMRMCKTEYINIFHGDDKMLPWMIEELVKAFESQPSVGMVATSDITHIGHSKIPRLGWNKPGRLYKKNEWVEEFCKKGKFVICPPSPMHRKTYFDKVPPRKKGSIADSLYWLTANNLGIEFYILDISLVEYRLHDVNNTSTLTLDRWLDVYKEVSDFLIEKGFDVDNYKKTFSQYTLGILGMKCETIEEMLELKGAIEKKMGCVISKKIFSDTATVSFLGKDIIKVSRSEESLAFFFKKMKRLSLEGLEIPWKRKIKWVLKYVLFRGRL